MHEGWRNFCWTGKRNFFRLGCAPRQPIEMAEKQIFFTHVEFRVYRTDRGIRGRGADMKAGRKLMT
jgi:hypothetical protein